MIGFLKSKDKKTTGFEVVVFGFILNNGKDLYILESFFLLFLV
jgi:hypothetical protein